MSVIMCISHSYIIQIRRNYADFVIYKTRIVLFFYYAHYLF